MSGCHKNNNSEKAGMVAIVLVIWTSLALSGLLFSLVSAHGFLLVQKKVEHERQAARDAAVLCRNMLLIELAQNAGFAPATGNGGPGSGGYYASSSYPFENGGYLVCNIESFISATNGSAEELKTSTIKGFYMFNNIMRATFTIEAKISIKNETGAVPEVIYTKETAESLLQ